MDSPNENNFTISSKETLLHHHHHHNNNDQQQQQPFAPKHARKNNPKVIFFTFLILLILSAATMTLSSIRKSRKPHPLDLYRSASSRYYCHLTIYPELCYDSISSIINTTVLQSNPGPIFSASLQVAINQLNNVTISITNDSLVGPRMSKCRKLVQDSLSRLNELLCTLRVDSDIESLTYEEMDSMKVWMMAAISDAFKCFLALEEIDDMVVDGDEGKMGVEEVKWGVDKARKYMINSAGLLRGIESILSDFYNPFIECDDCYDYTYHFDYRFLVCLYSAMYLFLGLLYLLFWGSN